MKFDYHNMNYWKSMSSRIVTIICIELVNITIFELFWLRGGIEATILNFGFRLYWSEED